MQLIPVILSGGSGTRLWPLSRASYPKQLLSLTGEDSLIQQTIKRTMELENVSNPLLVCNNEHRFWVAEQLLEIGITPLEIILEPVGRNTAPAIAVASFRCMEEDKDSVMLVLPADHLLSDIERFSQAVKRGKELSQDEYLITFGIKPNRPETGFGYIRQGKELGDDAFMVKSFVEKPPENLAKEYLASGDYLWNSGMFLFKPQSFLNELKKFAPEIYEKSKSAYDGAQRDLDFLRLSSEPFKACPSDSIDYAVMEKTDRCVVVRLDSPWSDIGSWDSLWEVSAKDQNNNVIKGDVILEDVSNSMFISKRRLLAAIGLKEIIVIETPDAVLIADKKKSQEIKKIVKQLKANGREELFSHSKVYRPWGSYESLVSGERFQVKLIEVKPGAKLSVQMHHHRAEHWIIVKGTAKVQRGDEFLLLTENQSTFIPLGTVHSLENPGKIPLELIEVQSGPYLGEDDIVRFEDKYGRS